MGGGGFIGAGLRGIGQATGLLDDPKQEVPQAPTSTGAVQSESALEATSPEEEVAKKKRASYKGTKGLEIKASTQIGTAKTGQVGVV